MNFFERQRQVRRVSARLVLLFVGAVIGIVLAIDLAVVLAFNGRRLAPAELAALVTISSVVTVAVIALAALFRTLALRGGGGRVARELGGVLVPPDTTDPRLRRLRNVVEEVSIASGVPVPEVYLLPEEAGINAFAAGWSTSDAAIAVTRGALERLNRDELQGVIAHEFSHIVNGDMRLNIRLMGLLFGILFLAVIGRTLLRTGFVSGGRSRGDNKGGNPLPLIGLAMVVAGYVGVLAGRLIKASVSRQREYLADASAVQFTRQTAGLAGALKKIGGLPAGSTLGSPKTEEVGHMLFGSGARLTALFATHPPLTDRIRALDPTFDPAQLRELARHWADAPPSGLREDAALGLTGAGSGAPEVPASDVPSDDLPPADAGTPVTAAEMIERVGTSSPAAYQHAETILRHIPRPFLDRARDPATVLPLLLGLLFSADSEVRTRQHQAIFERHGKVLADAAWQDGHALTGLHPMLRLPLAEIAFPALRHRSPAEQDAVLNAVATLIHADGGLSVFEYCLSRLLSDELRESGRPVPHWRARRHQVRDARGATATLLAVLAQAGHAEPVAAGRAFAAGVAEVLAGSQAAYAPPARGVLELESVWPELDDLRPRDKARLVAAAVVVISHDGVMTGAEIELLRTICALLHSPLPPLPLATVS